MNASELRQLLGDVLAGRVNVEHAAEVIGGAMRQAPFEDLGFARSRWESEAVAHRDARPARRYFEITAAGRKALTEAAARYPALRPAMRPEER